MAKCSVVLVMPFSFSFGFGFSTDVLYRKRIYTIRVWYIPYAYGITIRVWYI